MFRKALLLSAAGAALFLQQEIAHAQVKVDPETIVRALTPKAKPMPTRSILGPSRGIAIDGGEQAPQVAASIDLDVPFEYDQSAITMSDAQIVISTLAKALEDPRLAKMQFQIIGHTDGRGTDTYNDDLSARRAQAVLKRLVDFHKVDASRLKAIGRGKRELKDVARPDHASNRRVQIVTVESPSS